MREHILTFGDDGTVGTIYADELLPILDVLGDERETRRVSDVEPDGAGWSAWIRPDVPGGAVKLGPFTTRAEALTAEVAYLRRQL